MEQTPLVTTYVRYKRGTQKLIAWLSDSARSARKDKNIAMNARPPKNRTPPSTPLPIRVATAELVPLTQAIISATDPKIEIPMNILDVAQDVITGRKRCCEWYSALGKGSQIGISDVLESNGKHRHFLAVLEEVFLLLKREAKSRLPKRKKKMDFSTDISNLANLYEHLELEEPIDATNSTAPRIFKPSAVKTKKVKSDEPICELDDGQEELLFMIWSHFNDLFQIRVQARKSWKQYTNGEISFEAACHTATNAMTLAFRLSEDFATEHEELGTLDKILAVLGEENYVMTARACSAVTTLWPPGDMDDPHDSHLYSLCNSAEFLCMPAWCAMNDVLELSSNLLRDRERLERNNPRSTFPGHPFSKALLNIVGDLFEVLSEPEAKTRHLSPYFTADTRRDLALLGDEYTKQLLDMLMFEEISVGVLASTQMYIDIYDVLSGDLERGSHTSRASLERLDAAWTDFEQSLRIGDGGIRSELQKDTNNLLGGARRILKPGQAKNGREGWTICPTYLRFRKERADTFIPSSVMDTLPLFPMRCASVLLDRYQDYSVTIANDQQIMLSSAHVYRAAKIQGSVSTEWPDMEFVLHHQHQVIPLVRDGDGTMRTAAKQCSMGLGMTLIQVSKPSRPPPPQPAACFKRGVKLAYNSHYWRSFFDRFDLAYQHTFYQCIKSYATTGPGIKDTIIAKQWQSTQKLNPAQLLQTLQEVFVSEEPHLHFNYFDLMQRCVVLLGYVSHAYYNSKSRKPGKGEELVYQLAHEVLWDAADVERGGVSQQDTALWACGKVLQRMIDESGDINLEASRKISSGTIPADLAPSVLYRPDSLMVLPRASATPKLIVAEAECTTNEESITEEDYQAATIAEETGLDEQSDSERQILAEAYEEFSRSTTAGTDMESAVATLQVWLDERLKAIHVSKKGVIELGKDGEVNISTRPLGWDDILGEMIKATTLTQVFKAGIRLVPRGEDGKDLEDDAD